MSNKAVIIISSVALAIAVACVVIILVILSSDSGGANPDDQTAAAPPATAAAASATPLVEEETDTPEPTQEPTSEPTPEPTPEPIPEPRSTYLNDKTFKSLASIQSYCEKEFDSERLEISTLKVKTAQGMKKAYEIVGWTGRMGLSNYIFIKEDGVYHLYLSLFGSATGMTGDGDYLLTWSTAGGGIGGYNLYAYSESKKTYKEIGEESYEETFDSNGPSESEKALNRLCDDAGIDSDDLKEIRGKYIKTINLME